MNEYAVCERISKFKLSKDDLLPTKNMLSYNEITSRFFSSKYYFLFISLHVYIRNINPMEKFSCNTSCYVTLIEIF